MNRRRNFLVRQRLLHIPAPRRRFVGGRKSFLCTVEGNGSSSSSVLRDLWQQRRFESAFSAVRRGEDDPLLHGGRFPSDCRYQKGVYVFNGVAALVFPTAEVSTVPFYCLVYAGPATSFFFTTSETERSNALTAGGYSDCGITGYIYPTQVCGSVPLYRGHFITANTDYLYTTSAANRDNAVENQGFTDEGVAGYVLELDSGLTIN